MNNIQCPKCGRMPFEYQYGRAYYACLWNDCRHTYRDKCKYPNCSSVTNYPDLTYCKQHRDLFDFVQAIIYGHALSKNGGKGEVEMKGILP